ncbi:AmmeMemoRadiSam system protein B [Carboxylicivirga mesophila]|uniref:AmmeMemoRadiSam system protein B n=1 Tax=Carboxylicivirga mesophila TaxID=1166478 RepID=A0ABS5KCU7_9BACT|nr:AmmeMemoRadiSam system protein B [Carboxylicivirga mesophila]MBS2212818.1 AmmeMemoRadiSam system protein B [Carboxylicivirga mesophila]
MKRKAAVAGSFYPENPNQLKKQVEFFLDDAPLHGELVDIRAVIVPHAGYVYSGSVAAASYKQLQGKSYDTIFLIGASHKASFKGAATTSFSAFETPIGDVTVNQDIINELTSASSIVFCDDEVHNGEHTLEVQLPFIQQTLGGFKGIVPIIIGNDEKELQRLARLLKPYWEPSNLFIISTDFAHYPPSIVAEEEDKNTADAICTNSYHHLLNYLEQQRKTGADNLLTGLCGWSAVLTLLAITEGLSVKYHQLAYEHSGMKLYKDNSRVVGYHAIAVCNEKEKEKISHRESMYLLGVARDAIINHLGLPGAAVDAVQPIECQSAGVFVSVYVNDELRGCIGRFSNAPLEELIREQAVNAAFFDSRFEALTMDELADLTIEISVLTPMRLIADIQDIEMGRHGIYIKKGGAHGTFLPQVGARNNWTVEEYLGRCARDKALIGWDGWCEAEVYTYEAIIISDKDD